jgi:hypothetical protein
MAHEIGFVHVEVNSNGIRMAESIDYCRELVKAGMDTVYLQFDGLTPEPYLVARGANLLPIKKRVIENLREIDYHAAVLVPVLVKGVNDNQVGDIINYAIENRDIVRGVNFQPVAITGRINREKRDQMRITIPDLVKLTEEQTDGLIKSDDWFPVSSIKPLSDFMGLVKNSNFPDFSCHPHCGMGTYLYFEDDEVQPITSLVKVDKTLKSIENANEKMKQGKEFRAKLEIANTLIRNIKFGRLSRYLSDVISYSNYRSLNDMHHNMILIGSMHFMDPYNFDLERVQHCVIHYATPDGTIIPFCTMNNLHRKTIETKYAKPLSADPLTPLYDVKTLAAKINLENRLKQHNQHHNQQDHPMIHGED